jgi:type IV pilus assembly protein PilB
MSKIGELLVGTKQITQDQLNFCIEFKKTNPKDRIGAILKYHGFIDDLGLAEALSQQIGWPVYKKDYVPDQEVIERVGVDFLGKHQMFPLKNGLIPTFVISYIDNIEVTDLLRNVYGYEDIKFYIGIEKDVRHALDLMVLEQKRDQLLIKIVELKSKGADSISGWVDNLINLAIIARASDIHIEPTAKTTEIRFRIDGLLNPVCCHKAEMINTVANFLLTKCDVNTADYRIQDGSFEYEYKDLERKVDIRFNQLPTIHGPEIVLRLLRKQDAIPLQDLGYSEHNWSLIKQAIKTPEGIILVTGPTGCGKSTTLSALLNQIKSIDKKIITIEDPVERTNSLMTQVEIKVSQQLTYAQGIRAFLRHDPNVLLVGEIRDPETAHECLRAANLGLQIFSTLHSNNPVSAILRLKDLGVEPFNIASFLTAVISQRLVRKLCPHCKSPMGVDRKKFAPFEARYLKNDVQVIYRPMGCSKCKGGYLNRTVIAEVMLIDDEIKSLINKDRLGDIDPLLKERGTYKPMIEDIKSLIFHGETSIEEAVRVLG